MNGTYTDVIPKDHALNRTPFTPISRHNNRAHHVSPSKKHQRTQKLPLCIRSLAVGIQTREFSCHFALYFHLDSQRGKFGSFVVVERAHLADFFYCVQEVVRLALDIGSFLPLERSKVVGNR